MQKIPGLDLTNCDKEPIQYIGKAQQHGCILVVDPSNYKVTHYSKNIDELLGIKDPKNMALDAVLPEKLINTWKAQKNHEQILLPEEFLVGSRSFFAIPHFSENTLIVDVEPSGNILDPIHFQEHLTRILNEMNASNSIEEMCDQAVKLVKDLFGYNRVMMYQFDENWNGKVIAEDKEEELESWLGLHYPATDIPKPARDIFLKQGVRMIAEVDYIPSDIIPESSSLDLSKSELRAVSPIHIEYLQNMKVGASLTAAIVLNGELWGLLACHHSEPKFINYHQRQSCKFLTQVFSNKLALKVSNNYKEKMESSEKIRKSLEKNMNSTSEPAEALINFDPCFTDVLECGGGAFFKDEKLYLVGKTPSEEEVYEIIAEVLQKQKEPIFYTRQLPEIFPSAKYYKEVASGILSIRIDDKVDSYLLWFRPEIAQTVSWGGNPEKKSYYKDGKEYLSPRKSFKKWSQNQTGVSLPWKSYDVDAAEAVQKTVMLYLVQRQKEQIEGLNTQLREANQELETFSYSVSHDLRAPLRGIDGYARILRDDYLENSNENQQQAINSIIHSAEEMDKMIEAMLMYSKVGQTRVKRTVISIGNLVNEVLAIQNVKTSYPRTSVEIQEGMPNVNGDKRMLLQLFHNLLGNALKYSSNKMHPRVEIGWEKKNEENIFLIRDNGIGFNPELKQKVFDVFSRLVGEEYSGSGVGLSIAKKVIEKHKGRIWIETEPGKGTTFFFTLPDD